MKFDRDLLANANVRQTANSTMAIIDRIQSLAPPQQAAGLAAAFILLCERYSLEPQDIFTLTSNIMNHAEGRRPEFLAVRDYMENEL
jgi:hypothetical protein